MRHLYDSRMKKPTPPPIPVERGLFINENPSGVRETKETIRVSGTNVCFCETDEIKGVGCNCIREERALISD